MHKFCIAFLLLLPFLDFSHAGNEDSKIPPDGSADMPLPSITMKVDVDLVFLNLSVREKLTNRSLSGLQKSDFIVYEDGIQQDITQFLPTESPFDLLLLLDVSGSTGQYLKLMREAAIEFTREINEDDRVAVATFNSKVRLIQKFTNDRKDAEKKISHIKSGGGTAFYDALMTSLDEYKENARSRNAVVIFTDGIDNSLEGMWGSGSKTDFDELFRKIQEVDTIIYIIFLNTEGKMPTAPLRPHRGSIPPTWPGGKTGKPPRRSFPFPFPFPLPGSIRFPKWGTDDDVYRQAFEQLQLIADQTGGRLYSPYKIGELSDAYSEIAGDLRIQYQLGYNSTNRAHDGKWRKINVKVQDYPEAVVRTRKGYYAVKSREGE